MNKVEEDISHATTISFSKGMKFELVEDMGVCPNIPTQKKEEHSSEISRKELVT